MLQSFNSGEKFIVLFSTHNVPSCKVLIADSCFSLKFLVLFVLNNTKIVVVVDTVV